MRPSRRALLGAAAAVGVALAAPLPLVLGDRPDAPGTSDAVLVLGPPFPERVRVAEELMAAGRAKALVISVDSTWSARKLPACTQRRAYPVTCFEPEPGTTRGEGQELRRLAEANGWHSVQAITFRWHVNRARVILGRCFAGDVRVLETTEATGPEDIAHHVGGWYKVPFEREC
ncbi:MAG: hypothetical protein IPK37_09595 [Austwickia sp.]|jgi:hypothetical protein|nr:MAG: hypothetical protein IPK37_09595 [Austwickia sp.]